MITLNVKRVSILKPQLALPSYQTPFSAGLDLMADIEKNIVLEPGQRALIPTGLAVEIPIGYEAQIRPRSGLAIKNGISLVNSPGTIDADYRGEVKIIVINHGQETVAFSRGDRIAQMVIAPVVQAEIQEVTELSDTTRAAGGFGSTGK